MKKIINTININLNHNDDACSKFNDNILSKDLGNYIYEQYSGFKKDGEIKIIISSDEQMNDLVKLKLKNMIMEYFKSNITDLNRIHNKIYIKSFLLSIIGICLIIIAHFFNISHEFIVSEVLMIAGWVSLWEVFDNIVFKESKWHSKYNAFRKLIKSEIVFEEDGK